MLQINQPEEIGEKQISFFSSRGDQVGPLMHIALKCHQNKKRKSMKIKKKPSIFCQF